MQVIIRNATLVSTSTHSPLRELFAFLSGIFLDCAGIGWRRVEVCLQHESIVEAGAGEECNTCDYISTLLWLARVIVTYAAIADCSLTSKRT